MLYLLFFVLAMAILYGVVRAAVKEGSKEAYRDMQKERDSET